MDHQLVFICALTLTIHLIGTLSYAVRVAGVRTRRLAIAFALFSIIDLVSRTSNSVLAPFLAKRVETALNAGPAAPLLDDMRWLLVAATAGTLLGALLIPTFGRVFTRAVQHFQTHRSVPKLVLHAVFKGGIGFALSNVTIPGKRLFADLQKGHHMSAKILLLNALVTALWTVGVFASLYAGYLNPELRVTSSMLSAVVNGGATVLMAIVIDPHLSGMTEDAIEGKANDAQFRNSMIWLVGSRLAGTVLAQVFLVPAAQVIAAVARLL